MPTPKLHFIGNDSSAANQIVQWCEQQWPDQLPPGLLFCVPTALAMRRLRDALVKRYKAFHGVRFTQPAGLFNYFEQPESAPLATESELLCVWDRVFDWLYQLDKDNLITRILFPSENDWLSRPTARYTVAQRLIKLRKTLVEGGLDFGAVAEHPQTALLDSHEQHRWSALAALEQKYNEFLLDLELADPVNIQLEILSCPNPQPIEAQEDWRLIVACVPDMMPALDALLTAAPSCDILIQSTSSTMEHFTMRGTPEPTHWSKVKLDLPDTSITQAESPTDEAVCVERFLGRTGKINPAKICLGILNHELMPFLTSTFEAHGIQIFEPDPIRLSMQSATRLLRDLFQLAQSRQIEALFPLLTLPELATMLGVEYATLRKSFIELIDQHRPSTLNELKTFLKADTPEACFMSKIITWINAINTSPCDGARQVLVDLYGTQFIDPVKDALLFSTFEALQALFVEIENIRIPEVKKTDALFMTRINQITLHPIRGTAESSYEGRFELLWSDAEQFAIAGLNETIFPDTQFEDAFLPNTFRKMLGLRSDITRIARDAYILDTLCHRVPQANLSLTCSRFNANGDWIKPSRLFFQCDTAQQKERARRFFLMPAAHILLEGDSSALTFAIPLAESLKQHPSHHRFSPSAIRTFLTSPFLYWMRNVQHLHEYAPLEEGIQQNTVGILIHEALELLPTTQESDPDQLARLLLERFDTVFTRQYGQTSSIELLALRHAAHKRLIHAATLEAQLRKEGWQIRYTETDTIDKKWEVPLMIDGTCVTLHGRIDRIDYNPTTDTWRIIDYKTGSDSTEPQKGHYKEQGKDSGNFRWSNFQLPIYRLLTQHALALPPSAKIELAYFALPAKGDAEIATFKDPISEADTLNALRAVLKEMITLSEETLLQNPEQLNDPLLKHLLLSYRTTNESND